MTSPALLSPVATARRLRRFTAAVVLAGAGAALAASTYDDHVLFMNAPADGGLAGSQYSYVAPSVVEVQDGRFPTDTAHVVSPPNALRLHWRSAPGGDWQITVKSMERQSHHLPLLGNKLALWCYADSEITALNSPRLYLKDRDDKGSYAVTLVRGDERIPAGRWVRVLLDFSGQDNLYQGTDDPAFSLADTVSLTFMQGLDDNAEHTVWLDDIMLVDAPAPAAAPAPAPTALAVTGFERHCELSWEPAADPKVLAYRIYRSWDGKAFTAVGTQRGTWHRYEDFTGEPGRKAWYQVASVNLDGQESPPSDVASATTHCSIWSRPGASATIGKSGTPTPGSRRKSHPVIRT